MSPAFLPTSYPRDYSATTRHLLCASLLSGLLVSKGVTEIFNVHNTLSACCAHEGKMGTEESTQVLTWLGRTDVGGTRLEFESWKMRIHIHNASQIHFIALLKDIYTLPSKTSHTGTFHETSIFTHLQRRAFIFLSKVCRSAYRFKSYW